MPPLVNLPKEAAHFNLALQLHKPEHGRPKGPPKLTTPKPEFIVKRT